jgi:hypothetical protein
MAQVILQGDIFNKVGCTDTLATNYDPTAITPCVDCCVYGTPINGCTDTLATNYDVNATVSCNNCCTYTTNTTTTNGLNFRGLVTSITIAADTGIKGTGAGGCVGPYSITTNNEVLGVEGVECCVKNNTQLGPAPVGYQYYWDGKTCKIIPECPSNTTCVDCTNFDWWNDTYISNHNGQSLSVSSPILWQQIVDLVTNSGQTISVNTLNGEPISESCCTGVFKNGICFCEQVIKETYKPRCIATLTDFLNLISTTVGYNFFINNFSTIGPSIGLTTTQVNFIKLSINSIADSNSNGIQDLTEARLILSNALSVTGGFHVNFGTITNTPILMTKGVCDQYGGYWDANVTGSNTNLGAGTIGTQVGPVRPTPTGTIDLGGNLVGTTPLRTVGVTIDIPISPISNGNCMCKPVVDQCEIDLSQVQTISSFDFFNNTIQIVVLKQGNTPLNEACCNRLIKDNPSLGWEWQAPYCLASPREDCLPAIFELNNNNLMEVPPCGNDLELSMWVYFAKPKNPCQPIPDPPDNDIIVIDGAFCDITLTPNTGAVEITNNSINVETATNLASRKAETSTPIEVQPKNCCYNINNPILARVNTTDPTLNQFITQVKVYNSSTDYFDTWVQIKATLPTSGLTLNFGLNLEIYQGLNCCCDYDFFVDDIQVNCVGQVPSLVYNDIQCPGFNINRVIDNKKSWVYNPGLPSVGISEYDDIERIDGSFGLLNGEGSINRTFAPSLDASIPWRYTDYWNQSSVYENHSNLVLNSKELWLTYDMCADCPISGTTLACPSGYTLSAGTSVCYQSNCISYNINNTGGDCSVNYIDCNSTTITTIIVSANTSVDVCSTVTPYTVFACTGLVFSATTFCSSSIVSATTVNTVTYLSLYDLENYKKQFQSFWIPFMEQFIPATAIWVAGERWCNEVCTIINPCDYDFELVEAEVSIQEIPPGFFPPPPKSYTNSGFVGLVANTNTNISLPSGTSTATQPTNPQNIVPVVDLGLTETTPIIKTVTEASIDITAYRNRFTSPTIETIIL